MPSTGSPPDAPGCCFPTCRSAGGGGFAHARVVAEELARARVAFCAGEQGMVAQDILAYGSDAHKQAWLPRMARGERVTAIAMTESVAGSDLAALRTRATVDGDDYRVRGSKTFITPELASARRFLPPGAAVKCPVLFELASACSCCRLACQIAIPTEPAIAFSVPNACTQAAQSDAVIAE